MPEKQIAWYGPGPATPRQEKELQRLFGAGATVDYRGRPDNDQKILKDLEASGADETVMVARTALLELLLEQGVQPLYSQMEACDPDHPEVDVKLPNGKCFRFLGFKRLRELHLKYADVLEALPHAKPANIAWLSQHAPLPDAQEQLKKLYGDTTRIRVDSTSIPDANAVIARTRNDADRVLVAPLTIFGELAQKNIYPIQAKLKKGRTQLRRVLGLEMTLDEVSPM